MIIEMKGNGYSFEKFDNAIDKFNQIVKERFPQANLVSHFNYAECLVMTDLILENEYCRFNLYPNAIRMAGSYTLSEQSLEECTLIGSINL